MESLAARIEAQLDSYLAGRIQLATFEEWFVQQTWAAEQSGDQIAVDLTHEIELRLAEFSNGHWSEDELRERLAALVPSRLSPSKSTLIDAG